MITVALVLAGLAALVYLYIFWMESFAWTTPRVRKTFGMTQEQSDATKQMAYNQGFYNLFLAIAVIAGIILYIAGHHAVGATLVFVGAGSMAAAALVLVTSGPGRLKSAAMQGALPAFGVLLLAIGVL